MPSTPSFRLAPCVVLFSSMTTPVWLRMTAMPAPPAAVASAPTATYVPEKYDRRLRFYTLPPSVARVSPTSPTDRPSTVTG